MSIAGSTFTEETDQAPGHGKRGSRGDRDRKPRRNVDLSKLFDQLPPHAIEAEMAVLGSIILEWRVAGEVVQILQGADDFYKPAHSAIYQALIDLYDTAQSIDMVQLHQHLADRRVLDQVGGLDYLVELASAVPSASSAAYYAGIVRDKAILRRLIDTAGCILQDCYTSDEPLAELLDRVESDVFKIAQKRNEQGSASLGSLLEQVYADLLERAENHDGKLITGIECGFYELDDMLNGLQPGEMIIVAARPSMGKTAFALNLAEHIGLVKNCAVGFFSLEMSKEQLAQRLLCSRSRVDSHKLRRNLLNREEFAQLSMTVEELTSAPVMIDDTPGLTLMQLRAKARRMKDQHGIEALFIDYLQLMSAPSAAKEGRQNEVSSISRGIKALARELRVPVVCLSQLNRAAEQREGHRPRMSDLRESGSIEQDADVVMMLHRESYYHRSDPEWEANHPDDVNTAEVIVAKQRNGPTGTVRLFFDGGTTSFRNLQTSGSYQS